MKLEVINFSPAATPVNTPFNAQPDGNSGIYFELNRPATTGSGKVFFDDKPMTGVVVSKSLVTATIPVSYFATPGNYSLVLELDGERVPAGTFTVKPR